MLTIAYSPAWVSPAARVPVARTFPTTVSAATAVASVPPARIPSSVLGAGTSEPEKAPSIKVNTPLVATGTDSPERTH